MGKTPVLKQISFKCRTYKITVEINIFSTYNMTGIRGLFEFGKSQVAVKIKHVLFSTFID